MPLNPSLIWDNCLHAIKSEVSDQSFKTWFEPIVPLKLNNNTLTIQVPSKFFYEWLEQNYIQVLRGAISKCIGHEGMLEYSVLMDKPSQKNTIPVIPQVTQNKYNNGKVQEEVKSPFEVQQVTADLQSSFLNPSYVFNSFVEGDCNRLGRSAGLAVSQRPGATAFNPLMIYGGVGLGKTHLLQAIGNQIKQNHPTKFVLYVSSEKFTNQFINAVKNNTLQQFTTFYMNVDCLILDDVQFLAGKEKTQETFFHIFNHLHQTGKQIIMSSDRAPKTLEGFMDRLLSRFKWGLTADLQKPDYETKLAIIAKKLENDGLLFSDEVCDYIAQNVNTNIRELEGVLVSLMAHASLNQRVVDLELARKTIRGLVDRQKKQLTMENIFEQVANHYGVTIADLRGKSRKRDVVTPRQVAMYLCKELLIVPMVQISYYVNKDHTTIMYGVNTITEAIKTDKLLEDVVFKIKKVLA